MGVLPLDPQYIDAIKGFEGYSPNASWDYKQSSSGYGTKAQPGDENIPSDQLRAVHEQRFSDEVGKAAAAVDQFAPNLPAGTRAALVSLTYNAGPGWMNSGLGNAVKQGDFQTAATIFQQYNKAGGKVNQGLVNRRAAEAAWFGNGQPAAAQPASPMTAQATTPQPAAPMSLAPPQPGPPMSIAPPVQQQAQEQPQQAPPDFMAQLPAEQGFAKLPPIFTPQRRPVNVSALRAALQSAGNRGFYKG